MVELSRSEQIFETIVQNITEPVLFIDKDFEILWANKAFQEQTGYKIEEIIGNHCYRLTHHSETPCQLPNHLCPIAEVKKTGKTATVTHTHFDKEGNELFVEIMVYPVKDNKGKIIQFVYIYRDITERKRAEEALKQMSNELARSNADLKQFAYIVSHDLKEPLLTVEGFVKLLARRYKGKLDVKADEFIEYIAEGVRRMQVLIKDLLEYSQVGTKGEKFKSTDCSFVVDKAIDNLQAVIEESNAVVTYDELPTIMADTSQMISLFQNLIGNAIKFRSEEAPRVHISAERKGDEWVFSIQDNGIGIDLKNAERIFVVFQRLHNKDEYPGTGIGLAICKKIVERHGGHIWIESEIGKSSTFYFTIPFNISTEIITPHYSLKV